MPGLDGTGPMGAGPMTGGGRGLCGPYGRSYTGWGYGRGRGFRGGSGPGFGGGRGYGRDFAGRGYYPPQGGWYGPAYPTPYGSSYATNPEDEVNALKNEANFLKGEIDAINKRIEELESEPAAS